MLCSDAGKYNSSHTAKKIYVDPVFAFEWIKLLAKNDLFKMKATTQSRQTMVVGVCIILELYTEVWCFHYVGEFIRPANNSYLIISIHPHTPFPGRDINSRVSSSNSWNM